MTRYEKIRAALEDMPTGDIVLLHNRYCDEAGDMGNYIYQMDEFDEIMSGYTLWEVARACFYGDFRPCDDYFRFDGYGNLESFVYWKEQTSPIDADEIAQYIDENSDALGNDEMQAILDEEEK